MEEQPNIYRKVRRILWIPLALLLLLPAIVLLAVWYYVRATVSALISLVRYLLGYKTPVAPTESPTQPPHFLDNIPATRKHASDRR